MEDVIEEIKENIEEGEEAIEKVAEKGKEIVEDIIEKVKEKAEKVKKKVTEKKKEADKKSAKTKSSSLVKKSNESGDDDKELAKAAEAESTTEEKSLAEKKKELLKKAEKLKEKIEGEEISTEELKEKIKIKKREDMLIPLEEYVKSGIYIGTRVVTPKMKPFVYRRRADGLAIFNTDLIDKKLKEGIEYLSKFEAKDIIIVCKRQAGWRVIEKFSELTGIRAFTKKYPAGILTNTNLPNFFENELTIIVDSWLDRNALNDTLNVNKKVLMICDTNNFPKGAEQIIIGNNKSAKSLGVIFYLLARGYCKAKGLATEDIPDLDWWTNEEEEKKVREKIKVAAKKAEYGV